MHGANLFPATLPGFKSVVLSYMQTVTQLGHRLMEGLSLSLGLPDDYFFRHFTSDPLTLFRIFHYPPDSENPFPNAQWGVGEHTDYGVLTILKQDSLGGLQVKTRTGWIEAPYLKNTFVCNIGDMLDRMTSGLYRSTPHRVKNRSGQDRFSFPFFPKRLFLFLDQGISKGSLVHAGDVFVKFFRGGFDHNHIAVFGHKGGS
ncbi:MAG: isopenicillin N synthase family oxygenase [Bacteroidia bacterium]|nr:isopenicillin N synthase family oxygenase [Bacteroidia bacterium]